MNEWIYLIGITLFPGIELRGSIPLGVVLGYNPIVLFFVLTLTNILLIMPLLVFLEWFFHLLEKVKFVDFFVKRTQKKAEPYIEKYGSFGLALFVGVPLPGTGAYTGALAAHIFGLKKRKSFPAISVGVTIAGITVSLISTLFVETLGWLL